MSQAERWVGALALVVALAAVIAIDRGRHPARSASSGSAAMMAAASDVPSSTAARPLATPDESYGRLPLSFEPNVGQADTASASPVRFMSRGTGYALFLSPSEAVLVLRRGKAMSESGTNGPESELQASCPRSRELETRLLPLPASDLHPATPSVFRLKLIKANTRARVEGTEPLPGKSNYFLGQDPGRWRTGIPTFARVRIADVYPGVDLVYYGRQRRLEYDFVVSPGADPSAVRLKIEADSPGVLRLDPDGALRIGDVRMAKPAVYQPDSQVFAHRHLKPRMRNQRAVDGRYVLKGAGEVGFAVAGYDPARPLVIDPVLGYSTYLGGSRSDSGTGIAVDASGNAYVTGYTFSADFPTENPLQAFGGSMDAFVTKLNPNGSALVYSTYLGGSGDDLGAAIAVDASGSAYVTGSTNSLDFPVRGAFQGSNGGGTDAFVAKLGPDGTLQYSTYLGGAFTDVGQGIAIDAAGSAYVTGSTLSVDFPTQNPLQSANGGGYDAFVTKLSPSGGSLVYSTYLGGSADENNPFLSDVSTAGIAVDDAGNAYLAGYTPSIDFPTKTPLQVSNHGFINAFVSEVNASGSALVYSTYLGGRAQDFAHAIAVDSAGNAYVTGSASSADFPTLNGLPGNLPASSTHAFLAKLATGGSLVYATLLGGSRNDFGLGVGLDGGANVYITGFTNSPDFPVVSRFGGGYAGGYDAFVTKFAPSGAALVYSTYLGGSRDDHGTAISIDAAGNAYLTGDTLSPNFPVSGGAFKTTCGANGNCASALSGPTPDAFVAKISPVDAAGANLSSLNLSFGSQKLGTTSPAQTVTLENVGSQPLVVRRILTVPNRSFTETSTCPAALAPAASCTISIKFTPASAGMVRGFLIIFDNAWPRRSQLVKLTGNGT